jgi:hypothetical protein
MWPSSGSAGEGGSGMRPAGAKPSAWTVTPSPANAAALSPLKLCGSKKSLVAGIPIASVLFAGQPLGLIVLRLMIFHQIELMVCAALARHYASAPTHALDLETQVAMCEFVEVIIPLIRDYGAQRNGAR